MTMVNQQVLNSGCCEEGRRAEFSRRQVLAAMGVGAAAVGLGPLLSPGISFAATPWTGDTIVLLSLRGGFDGLNAVAPVNDPNYQALRPGIKVPVGSALRLDSRFGLHPALRDLLPLWNNGKLGLVHATGLAQPNRSHFEAMEEIERAAPGSSLRTGWLGRTLGMHTSSGAFNAVQVGWSETPRSLAGAPPVLSMNRLRDVNLSGADDATRRTAWSRALSALHSTAPSDLRNAASTTLGALSTAARLQDDDSLNDSSVVYPNTDTGRALKDIARIIKAKVGARVITLDVGNWDMHVDLGRIDGGWMYDSFRDLGASLAAFAADLGDELDRTTLVTLSEFGRRAEENESNGVDHGWGNVMMLLGGHVRSGSVLGTWPGLRSVDLADGDLRATTDYRAVLADVLSNRTGASVAEIRSVFPGFTGATLGVTTQ